MSPLVLLGVRPVRGATGLGTHSGLGMLACAAPALWEARGSVLNPSQGQALSVKISNRNEICKPSREVKCQTLG